MSLKICMIKIYLVTFQLLLLDAVLLVFLESYQQAFVSTSKFIFDFLFIFYHLVTKIITTDKPSYNLKQFFYCSLKILSYILNQFYTYSFSNSFIESVITDFVLSEFKCISLNTSFIEKKSYLLFLILIH